MQKMLKSLLQISKSTIGFCMFFYGNLRFVKRENVTVPNKYYSKAHKENL